MVWAWTVVLAVAHIDAEGVDACPKQAAQHIRIAVDGPGGRENFDLAVARGEFDVLLFCHGQGL